MTAIDLIAADGEIEVRVLLANALVVLSSTSEDGEIEVLISNNYSSTPFLNHEVSIAQVDAQYDYQYSPFWTFRLPIDTETSENMKESMLGPILHVVVVGFHHKKGCQVEFSFPPLIPGSEPDSNTCPPGWKYLPTLALPDGSHNFEADTVYFHLPSLTNPKQTVYGISCFRQIPVEKSSKNFFHIITSVGLIIIIIIIIVT
uniref:UDENN domain-containing protein n=1 Tax=Timema cristinae TaxID=61476 RepID=A0A7R9GSY5_TIMCR|nr:unnamed protein product [Timema cristinae]